MAPLAAVIAAATALGFGAEHRWPEGAVRAADRVVWVVLWVLLPIVSFFNLAALELTAEVGAGIGFAYAGMAVALGAAFLVGGRVLRLPRPSVGALMNSSALANTGYLGLPFTVAVLGFGELPNAVAYDVLVSGIATVTVGFSVGAAFGTVADRPRERIAAFFVRNPPLWASAAGLLAPSALAPEWAVDATRVLVLAILPLGFFAVGVTLAAEAEEGVARFPPPLDGAVATAIAIKLVVPVGVVLGLSEVVVDVPDSYLTQAAMASAISNIVIANEYGLDRGLVAAAIVWTTAAVVAVGTVAVLL